MRASAAVRSPCWSRRCRGFPATRTRTGGVSVDLHAAEGVMFLAPFRCARVRLARRWRAAVIPAAAAGTVHHPRGDVSHEDHLRRFGSALASRLALPPYDELK